MRRLIHSIALLLGSGYAQSHRADQSYNVAPRASFQKVFEAVYRQRLALSKPRVSPAPPLSDLQDLALVFMTMAHGCLHNLEFPPNDPLAETYAASGRAALSKGNLLSMPTISGIQALVSRRWRI